MQKQKFKKMRFNRYIRQVALKEFGYENQLKMRDASVLIVGAGGLGIPILLYLNAMGIGTIGIVDDDKVTESNLHRQVIYKEEDIGKSKVDVVCKFLKRQNSETSLELFNTMLSKDNAMQIIEKFQVIVDATDNFPTRYLINDACVMLGKPIVYGALHGFEGQISVFNYENGPTYRCLYPMMPNSLEIPNCNDHGTLGITPGIVGTLQAMEVIKVICRIGDVLSGKLMIYNALTNKSYFMSFDRKEIEIESIQDDYSVVCNLSNIKPAEFMSRYRKQNLQIVDVRTKEEFSDFNLDRSISIPLDRILDSFSLIDSGETVYVLCQSGIRSQKALALLLEKFPKIDAVQVEGGLNAIFENKLL